MTSNSYVNQIPEMAQLVKGANHVDVKVFEGDMDLRPFIAGMLSYQPGWMTFLYGVRWFFVRLLGMKQQGLPQTKQFDPQDISFKPGDKAAFFTVCAAEEGRFWVAEAAESHLTARLGVVAEPMANGRSRFHVITIVHYNSWAGPVYFNVIRPFHHIVVASMGRAAIQLAA